MVLTKYISSCWTLEFSINANKDLHKLEKPIKQRILDYFKENVLKNHNPRTKGKPLSGKLAGQWGVIVLVFTGFLLKFGMNKW